MLNDEDKRYIKLIINEYQEQQLLNITSLSNSITELKCALTKAEEKIKTLSRIISAKIEESNSRYISKEERYAILKRQKWKCNFCHCQLKYSSESSWQGEVAHIDHIHPWSLRHTYPKGEMFINELANLQALCPSCNLKKGGKNGK